MVCVGGVVWLLADLRRGRVTEEQDVLTSPTSPLPLSTQLGRLCARGHRRSCAPVLPPSLPRATPALSLLLHLRQPQPRGVSVSEYQPWGRRSSCPGAGQSKPSFFPARIFPIRSRPCIRVPIALPRSFSRLQPAITHHQEADQSGGREQKVYRPKSGGFAYEEVSETEQEKQSIRELLTHISSSSSVKTLLVFSRKKILAKRK